MFSPGKYEIEVNIRENKRTKRIEVTCTGWQEHYPAQGEIRLNRENIEQEHEYKYLRQD